MTTTSQKHRRRRGRAIRKARRLRRAGRSPFLIRRTLGVDLARALAGGLAPIIRAAERARATVAQLLGTPPRRSDYVLMPPPLPSLYAHRRPLLHNGRKHR